MLRAAEEDETAGVVNKAFASLDFNKGDASLSLMVLNTGIDSHVAISTSGLEVASTEPTEATPGTPEVSMNGVEKLLAEDKDGLPVPSGYTEYTSESGPYRQSLTAVSPAPLKPVLALYRAELTARKWARTTCHGRANRQPSYPAVPES